MSEVANLDHGGFLSCKTLGLALLARGPQSMPEVECYHGVNLVSSCFPGFSCRHTSKRWGLKGDDSPVVSVFCVPPSPARGCASDLRVARASSGQGTGPGTRELLSRRATLPSPFRPRVRLLNWEFPRSARAQRNGVRGLQRPGAHRSGNPSGGGLVSPSFRCAEALGIAALRNEVADTDLELRQRKILTWFSWFAAYESRTAT